MCSSQQGPFDRGDVPAIVRSSLGDEAERRQMAERFNNRVELKDGEIILFHREGAKRPIWHMRIHVRGMRDIDGNTFSHIQETTGEPDLDDAKRVALERYDSLRLRVRSNQPARSVSFAEVYAQWWVVREAEIHAAWKAKGRFGASTMWSVP